MICYFNNKSIKLLRQQILTAKLNLEMQFEQNSTTILSEHDKQVLVIINKCTIIQASTMHPFKKCQQLKAIVRQFIKFSDIFVFSISSAGRILIEDGSFHFIWINMVSRTELFDLNQVVPMYLKAYQTIVRKNSFSFYSLGQLVDSTFHGSLAVDISEFYIPSNSLQTQTSQELSRILFLCKIPYIFKREWLEHSMLLSQDVQKQYTLRVWRSHVKGNKQSIIVIEARSIYFLEKIQEIKIKYGHIQAIIE